MLLTILCIYCFEIFPSPLISPTATPKGVLPASKSCLLKPPFPLPDNKNKAMNNSFIYTKEYFYYISILMVFKGNTYGFFNYYD